MGDALYCNVHFAIDQISFEMHLLMGCAPTQTYQHYNLTLPFNVQNYNFGKIINIF